MNRWSRQHYADWCQSLLWEARRNRDIFIPYDADRTVRGFRGSAIHTDDQAVADWLHQR